MVYIPEKEMCKTWLACQRRRYASSRFHKRESVYKTWSRKRKKFAEGITATGQKVSVKNMRQDAKRLLSRVQQCLQDDRGPEALGQSATISYQLRILSTNPAISRRAHSAMRDPGWSQAADSDERQAKRGGGLTHSAFVVTKIVPVSFYVSCAIFLRPSSSFDAITEIGRSLFQLLQGPRIKTRKHPRLHFSRLHQRLALQSITLTYKSGRKYHQAGEAQPNRTLRPFRRVRTATHACWRGRALGFHSTSRFGPWRYRLAAGPSHIANILSHLPRQRVRGSCKGHAENGSAGGSRGAQPSGVGKKKRAGFPPRTDSPSLLHGLSVISSLVFPPSSPPRIGSSGPVLSR